MANSKTHTTIVAIDEASLILPSELSKESRPTKPSYRKQISAILSSQKQEEQLAILKDITGRLEDQWRKAHAFASQKGDQAPKNPSAARYRSGLWHDLYVSAQDLQKVAKTRLLTEADLADLADHSVKWQPYFGPLSRYDQAQIASWHTAEIDGQERRLCGMFSLTHLAGYGIMRASEQGWTVYFGQEDKRTLTGEQAYELIKGARLFHKTPYDPQVVFPGGPRWNGLVPNGVTFIIPAGSGYKEGRKMVTLPQDVRLSMPWRDFNFLYFATVADRSSKARQDEGLVALAEHVHRCLGEKATVAQNLVEVEYCHHSLWLFKKENSEWAQYFEAGQILSGYQPKDFTSLSAFRKGWERRRAAQIEAKAAREEQAQTAKAVAQTAKEVAQADMRSEGEEVVPDSMLDYEPSYEETYTDYEDDLN